MRLNTGRAAAFLLKVLFCALLAIAVTTSHAQNAISNENLALEATARSWESHGSLIPEHAPAKANDASFHSYWAAPAEALPVDLGLEWPTGQNIGSVIVRYFDGRMVRGPATARTQQWTRLQYWHQGGWHDVDSPEVVGEETSVVRYIFTPIKTTRVRLLFTEPPDPEFRRNPDSLGIYVCELEAYEQPPFQVVEHPGLTIRDRYNGGDDRLLPYYYNEPPSGDSSYNLASPLIIEPKHTAIFRDTLTSTLVVAESRWAKQKARIERVGPQAVALENGFLKLEISGGTILQERRLTNLLTGEKVEMPQAEAFRLRTATADLLPENFSVRQIDTSGSDENRAQIRVLLDSPVLAITVHYELRRQDHFYHKWLGIRNKGASDVQLRDITVSSLGLPNLKDLMAGPELTYPISRSGKGGFFSALETVYWDHVGDALTYYPAILLKPGTALESEKAAIGVYRNRGEIWRGWDRGVREWVIEYHAQVSPVGEEWPDVYCEGWSAGIGLQAVSQYPQWAEHFFDTAEKLGIRYMDGFDPMHIAMRAKPESVSQWVEMARRHNIATGFWVDFGSDVAEWDGIRPQACQLSPEANKYLDDIVDFVGKYQFKAFHWGDFLTIFACDPRDSGGVSGKYSIYQQGQRILKFAADLRKASPGVMLGADGGFSNPQYVRYQDSRAHGIFYGGYLSDHFPAAEPDIHLDRLYADMDRNYEFGGHFIYLRPWYRMLNVVNHYGQESRKFDHPGFRYGLLSAIAMAGQVTFNAVPDDVPEADLEFSRRWLAWARTNRDYLKQGDRLFDRTFHFMDLSQGTPDSLSGFSHIRGDRGYVFLLNPSPVEQVAELSLVLDAPPASPFFVDEVYPNQVSLRGPDHGHYVQGGKLRVTVPAKQVRILWIGPAEAAVLAGKSEVEEAQVNQGQRYLDNWKVTNNSSQGVTVQSTFLYPQGSASFLSGTSKESDWAREPWAYNKAYLVFLIKDETGELGSNWVADNFVSAGKNTVGQIGTMSVSVNGVAKTIHAFVTGRNQPEKLTRCYFVDLAGEITPNDTNNVTVTLPIRNGIVFQGAYIDLPDQMP